MTADNKNDDVVSPTVNFLLAAVRFSLGITNENDLAISSQQEIDWNVFNDLVQYHRLESVIHNSLGDTTEHLFPEATANRLKQSHIINTAVSLLLSVKVIEISREFQDNEIPVLLVKGLSVEQWLYEKPGQRSSGDIDLFIKYDDFPQALSCLISMGYDLAYLPDRIIPGSRLCKQIARFQKDISFEHRTSKVIVELHWRLARVDSAFPLNFDEAWEARSDCIIADRAIQTLPQDMHAVYLCYHGAKHCWSRLFWLYDFAKLMLKQGTDWEAILSQAQHLKAEASVGLAVVLASRVFLTATPEIFSQHTDLLVTGKPLSDDIFYKILADTPDWPSGDLHNLKSLSQIRSWDSRIHPSRNYVLSEWLRYLFSPDRSDWESLRLPDFLTPLYCLWRPMRFISKGLSSLKSSFIF